MGELWDHAQVAVDQAAGEAHWQVGKVERHGGLFEQVLTRLLSDMKPQSERDYELVLQFPPILGSGL